MKPHALPLLLLLLAVPAPAQNVPAIGETIEVSIVNVDVFVTDKQGNRVRGLTKDDFEIMEAGVRRSISNFAEYSSLADTTSVTVDRPEQSVVAPAAPREPRTIVVFIEQMHIPKFQGVAFITSIRELLHKLVEPGDAVSLVIWERLGNVELAFTDDLATIDEKLEKAQEKVTSVMFDPARLMREELSLAAGFNPLAQFNRPSGGGGTPSRGGIPEAEINASIYAIAAMGEMKRRVHSINAAINGIAGREGKKILLLATRRLGDVAGGEFFYMAGATRLTPQTRQEYETTHLMKTITDNANAADITIYTLYAPGTGSLSSTTDASSNLRQNPLAENQILLNETLSLGNIAEKTGGLLAASTDEIVKLLPRVAEDVNDYYSLAYRVTATRADRARNIEVRTKNRDLVVRSRRQFVEKSDETRMKDRVLAALFGSAGDGPFAVKAQLGEMRRQGHHQVVPLRLRIPINAFTTLPANGKQGGAFSVYIASAIDIGRVSDVTHKTQTFELADTPEARFGNFTYSVDVVIDGRTDRISVGVLDEVSKEYALLRVTVPGRERVAAR